MLEAGLLAASAEDVTQIVKANFLADIKLDQDQHRALPGLVVGLDGLTVRCRGKNRSAFGFHGISAFSRQPLTSSIVYCPRKQERLAVRRKSYIYQLFMAD